MLTVNGCAINSSGTRCALNVAGVNHAQLLFNGYNVTTISPLPEKFGKPKKKTDVSTQTTSIITY